MANAFPCPQADELKELASGRLPLPRLEPLVEHLETCATCFARVQTLSSTDTLMEVIVKAKSVAECPEEDLVARLIDKLTLATPAPGEEQWGLPTTILPGDKQSPADATGQTALGNGRRDQDSGSFCAEVPPPEMYDFLAAAETTGEIGRLGPYRILKVLGAGGMGVVFLAEDPRLERQLAIKAMRPALAASPTARHRFLREARTAAAIEHDHILPIFQVGEDRGVPFIAMPLLKGEPLDERLHRDKVLPVTEILRIGRETAQGLAAAHAAGLVHRDIKPANIWLQSPTPPPSPLPWRCSTSPGEGAGGRGGEGEGARVKILDFGLARPASADAQLTQEGAIIGTPAYMAPEQAAGQAVDARCDLFSLGCVLYRMCTGQAAFRGPDTVSTLIAVAINNPPAPVELRPELPKRLSDLVMHLLEKDPAKRLASADAVVEAMRDLEREVVSVAPAAKGGEAPTRKRPIAFRLALGGALVAASVAGIVLFWQTPYGTVKIESDDPTVEVVFDNKGPTIKGAASTPIPLRAGKHGIQIKQGDVEVVGYQLAIKKGDAITIKLEMLKGKVQIIEGGRVLGGMDFPPNAAPLRPAPGEQDRTRHINSLGMEFALVPAGRSWLGGGAGLPGNKEVKIPQDFFLGIYEVTQEEWQKVMGKNPSFFSRTGGGKEVVKDIPDAVLKRFPVENVSWADCQAFVTRLNEKVKERGWISRLPTWVEWEYACRGGPMADKSASAFDFYLEKPTNQMMPKLANFKGAQELKRPRKVGSYAPNRLGLFDMHGNVGECCLGDSPAANGAWGRMGRGGSWHAPSDNCRAGFRGTRKFGPLSWRGLRVARVPTAEPKKAPAKTGD